MNQQDIFEYLKSNLTIKIIDASEPSSCGGEISGSLKVGVALFLTNPLTNENEEICRDETYLENFL